MCESDGTSLRPLCATKEKHGAVTKGLPAPGTPGACFPGQAEQSLQMEGQGCGGPAGLEGGGSGARVPARRSPSVSLPQPSLLPAPPVLLPRWDVVLGTVLGERSGMCVLQLFPFYCLLSSLVGAHRVGFLRKVSAF